MVAPSFRSNTPIQPVRRRRRNRRWLSFESLSRKPTTTLLIVVVVFGAFLYWNSRPTSNEESHSQVKNLLNDKDPTPEGDGGYLVFPLSMGRYGNQMEHLLDVLGRIPKSGRTLVLPPFTSYKKGSSRLQFIPVESIFHLDRLKEYYPKIIPMQDFIESGVWEEPRRFYCYRAPCEFQGNPVLPFWNHYGISSVSESFELGNGIISSVYKLPAHTHPVIALSNGAPARYPMLAAHRYVAKYFEWKNPPVFPNDAIVVAAHVRAGTDWIKACRGHGIGSSDFMASPQCHSPSGDEFVVTESICLPNTTEMVHRLQDVAGRAQQRQQDGKRLLLYVASDVPSISRQLMDQLGGVYDDLLELPGSKDDPFVDLAALSLADYLVGNCVSSFTSFSARMRESGTTEFFGVEPLARP